MTAKPGRKTGSLNGFAIRIGPGCGKTVKNRTSDNYLEKVGFLVRGSAVGRPGETDPRADIPTGSMDRSVSETLRIRRETIKSNGEKWMTVTESGRET